MNAETRDKIIMEIHATVSENANLIKRHDRTLYGNGQPGLCKRLNDLETKIGLSSKWAVTLIATASTLFGGIITLGLSILAKRLAA